MISFCYSSFGLDGKSHRLDKLSESRAFDYPKAYVGTPRGEACSKHKA